MSDTPISASEVIEEHALCDLESILAAAKEPYYCVDALRDPRTKRKLIDPRSVLTPGIVRNLCDFWGVNRDKVIRVTRDIDAVDEFLDVSTKSISHYANQMHRYLTGIFTVEKPGYKAEVQGLAASAAEMLEGVLGYEKILEGLSVGPADIRPVSSYYDHLVNTAVYWLAAMARLNRERASEAGSIEVWRSKSKDEMSRLAGPRGAKVDPPLYYDYYGWERAVGDIQQSKKGDLSLVLSGFFAALFHDAAFLDEPEILISVKGRIDEKLKSHVDASNKVIKDRLAILHDERPLARNIIKNHHELADGSGYPAGKKEKDLHLFAQILSVCDMYDEYATKFTRGKVVRLILQGAGRGFTGDAVRAFLSILNPYEQGERLNVYELKNSEPAALAEVLPSENRLRPLIKIIEKLSAAFPAAPGSDMDLSLPDNAGYFV